MGWPYHFVTLTPVQLEERRKLLDQAGYYAYLAPVIALTSIYVLRQLFPTPNKGAAPTGKLQVPGILTVQKRRLVWWLNEPLSPEFGARKVHFMGLAYAAFLLFLVFRKTGDDYLHLTKRFGHVAASQLPFHYMMAIKSPLSPVQIATGLTWEKMNDYHRLFGRIVHLMVATHATLYLNFFVQAGLLSKRFGDWDVRTGFIAFVMFNILAGFSVPPVRKGNYHQKFFRSHVVQSGLVPLVLFFHVTYIRKYVVQAFILYVFNAMTRGQNSSGETLSTVTTLEGTSVSSALLKLRIPTPLVGGRPLTWVPGQHVYLKRSIAPTAPRNPFTIVSVPPDMHRDGGTPNVDIVIRNRGGPGTRWLEAKHHQIKADDRMEHVMIEGPYGEAKEYMPPLLESNEAAGKILCVAGGIGATYTIPIYLSLLRKRKSTVAVHFIWFVHSVQDAAWGIPLLNAAKCDVDVRIYLTRDMDKSLLVSGKAGLGELKPGIKILNYGKRPPMKDIMDRYFAPPTTVAGAMLTTGTRGKDYTPVTVLCCGPPALMDAVRTEVGKHVYEYGRDVSMHEERFGHGAALEADVKEETFRQKGLRKVLQAQSL
jgi:NAD(P)H-flavin reductase